MRKGNILSGRSWRRLVRVLACITVFCTTYALILPAITQEAHAFCGSQEHKHTEECFEDILTCTKEEHVHDASCQDCQLEEHTHSEDCYRQLLKCEMEEHVHGLECFSDPEADVETEADWKKTLPQDTEDLTSRERIVATAESQEGYRESEKNYQAKNETETKGWTRYGSWDGDPYEDWTGAYVRFVLHYSQISTEDAKGLTADWLEQLYKKDALESAENAEPGDVLFVYDETDELKAGIVTKTTDTTITALMGDWKDKVAKEAFAIEDEDIHSIWKPVASERKDEKPEEPEPEMPAQEEPAQEEPKADTGKPEEKEAEKESAEVSYDYTQQAEAEDGAIIRASWNEGTFETEDVVFQARKVELSEEEQKKIQEHLDQDKDYSYLSYDLTFYVRGEDAELAEIEPSQLVKVEITLPEETECDEEYELFHTDDSGAVDHLVEQGTLVKGNDPAEALLAEFESDSFSLFTVVIQESRINEVSGTNPDYHWGTIDENDKFVGKINRLNSNITITTTTYFFKNDFNAAVIDLNGHSITVNCDTAYSVSNNFTLILMNSAPSSESTQYSDSNATYSQASVSSTNVPGIIRGTGSNGNLINVTGGRVWLQNITLIGNNTQLHVDNGFAQLDNSYLLKGSRGLCATANSKVEVNGGAISDHPDGVNDSVELPGAGIYAAYSSVVTLDGGATVANNTVKAVHPNNSSGGGIHVTQATLHVKNASINGNREWVDSKDGSWATGGGIKATEGALICLYDGAKINGNFSDNSGGGISLSGDSTKLYMYGGIISNNCAQKNEGGGLALQAKDGQSTAVLYAGDITGNKTNTGDGVGNPAQWGGGGIFVGEDTRLVLPYGADVTGNTAGSLGGGIAGCATGKVYIDEKVVTQGNKAEGNGVYSTGEKPEDKERATSEPYKLTNLQAMDYFTCYQANIPAEFSDKEGNLTGAAMSGKIDGVTVSDISEGRLGTQYCLGLTSGNTAVTQDKPVRITNNSSHVHGGGILVNGYMVSGDIRNVYKNDAVRIKGNKSLVSKENNQSLNAGGYQFQLTDKSGDVIGLAVSDSSGVFEFSNIDFGDIGVADSVTQVELTYFLQEVNDSKPGVEYDTAQYTISFKVDVKLLNQFTYDLRNEEGKITTVTVYEFDTSVVENSLKIHDSNGNVIPKTFVKSTLVTQNQHQGVSYKSVYSLDLSDSSTATFQNSLVGTTEVAVEKKWVGDPEESSHDPVQVQLYRYLGNNESQRERVGDPVELSEDNDWKYVWKDLISKKNTDPYTYIVEENVPDGYISKVEVTDGTRETTHEVEVWKPVNNLNLTANQEYLLINTENNRTLSSQGLSTGVVNETKIYQIPDEAVIDQNNVRYYRCSLISGAQVLTRNLTESTRKGTILDAGSNSSLHLLGDYDQNALQWSNNFGSYNDLNGFYLDGNNLKMYGYGTNTDKNRYIGWSDNTFSLSTAANSNIKVYEKGTIKITEAEAPGFAYVITNERISNSLNLVKKSSLEPNDLLEGAEFSLYKDGELIISKTSKKDGTVTFENLGSGTYILKETKAPEGYQLSEKTEWSFSFDNTETQNAHIVLNEVIENDPYVYELPETGSIGTRFITATGGVLLLTASGLYGYNRKRKRKGGESS